MQDQNKKILAERIALNPTKAGLGAIDKDKVNAIIYEASKGSKFFQNEERKDKDLVEKTKHLQSQYESLKKKDLTHEWHTVEKLVQQLESKRDMSQTIVLVDMDAFYANVEMRDNPKLNNVPMAVGGKAMLCTANYHARKFGVRSAMPGYIAKKLCPGKVMFLPDVVPTIPSQWNSLEIIIVPPNYSKYSAISLDEAYLNLTSYLLQHPEQTAEQVVNEMRTKIFEETKLTASAGIACNKMLAKICADLNKPNGQYYLKPCKEDILEFLSSLPIRKVSGIGRIMERQLQCLNISTCKDLFESRVFLYMLFQQTTFHFLLSTSMGIGSSTIDVDYVRKSISVERTFHVIRDKEGMLQKLKELSMLMSQDLEVEGLMGKTVTLKLKLENFEVRTRAKTWSKFINSESDLYESGKELLEMEVPSDVRLMGLRVSNLKFEKQESSSPSGLEKYFSKKDMLTSTDDLAEEEDVECPVCSKSLHELGHSNILINAHIDDCLSKKELQSGLHKRTSESSSTKSRKSPKTSGKTLMDYFKLPDK